MSLSLHMLGIRFANCESRSSYYQISIRRASLNKDYKDLESNCLRSVVCTPWHVADLRYVSIYIAN